jgi:hypothetical protein
MKMGTIASPWRYDDVSDFAFLWPNVRAYSRLPYCSLSIYAQAGRNRPIICQFPRYEGTARGASNIN